MMRMPRGLFVGLVVASAATLSGARSASATDMPPVTWMPAAGSNYGGGRSPIDLVVIHKAEGSTIAAAWTFQDPTRQASAHYSVGDGVVYQMVDESTTAWHCGNWDWNLRSIGIENGGWTYRDDMDEAHYQLLAQLVANICERYGIPKDRSHIVGHDEVPDPNNPGQFGGAGHHTDPGPYFDWGHFIDLVNGGGAPPPPPPPPAPAAGSAQGGVQVATAVLNVRDGAWGNVIGQLSSGQSFVKTGNSDQGFVEVYFRGGTGWLYEAYVTGASFWGCQSTVPDLNVRDDAWGNVVGQIHAGQLYQQLQATDQWRLIQFDQEQRWVYRAYASGSQINN